MEQPREDLHYQHHRHNRPNLPNHLEPPPSYYQPQQQLQPQPQPQPPCQYFNRNDHFVEPTIDPNFNNPNPDGYSNFNNNHQMRGEPNESFGGASGGGFCSSGRKRCRFLSDHNADSVNVKLYIATVPSTTTEENIRPLFEVHGRVVEVVFPRDKRNGQRQGYCFIKFATMEEADGAIRALSGRYTFPGEACPIQVRYADGERERLGIVEREWSGRGEREPVGGGEFVDKVYVGSINKQASKKQIEEMFSAYGHVEDVYISRDSQKQIRCAFIKFSHREMALAAIKALNGTFTMRGCDQPLVVRFADPKKRRTGGELRGNHALAGQNFGPCVQEPMIRPPPYFGNGMEGYCLPYPPYNLPNPPYPMQEIPTYAHPQAIPDTVNLAHGSAPIIEQPVPLVRQLPTQPGQMPLQQTQALQNCSQSSQQAVSEITKQSQNLEQQQSAEVPMEPQSTGGNSPAAASAVSPSSQTADPEECDWSEHFCPDGYKYYYNSVTSESRWEKPDELTSFQQQKQQKVQNLSQQLHSLSTGFCGEEID